MELAILYALEFVHRPLSSRTPVRAPFPAMDPLEVLREYGGAARFERLRPRTSRRALRAAVAVGEVVQPSRGVYALPDTHPELVAATVLGGVRSCHSAASALGLDLVDPPSRPHITSPPGSRGSWPG